MGILNGLMGNASEIDEEQIELDLSEFLIDGERVDKAYKMIRDIFIFTDKRLILIDKQGVTGRKTEYLSIPYQSIVFYSIETAGTLDLESELKIFIKNKDVPIQKTFAKGYDINSLQRTLAKNVLN